MNRDLMQVKRYPTDSGGSNAQYRNVSMHFCARRSLSGKERSTREVACNLGVDGGVTSSMLKQVASLLKLFTALHKMNHLVAAISKG